MSAGPTLRVGSAFPDPPSEVEGDAPTGFDVEFTRALADHLGRRWELHRYEGADFEGIFAGPGRADDLVASGATVTDHRRTLAHVCTPYLRSGQSLVVAAEREPHPLTVDDLRGGVVGVQQGNTSQPVVQRLCERGLLGGIRRYDYDEIRRALDDVEAGAIDGFMKLEPVTRWFLRDRPLT